jgi:hypothetical protein
VLKREGRLWGAPSGGEDLRLHRGFFVVALVL